MERNSSILKGLDRMDPKEMTENITRVNLLEEERLIR